MLTRRRLLDLGMASSLIAAVPRPVRAGAPAWLNHVHSGLNPTPVRGVQRPDSLAALQSIVRDAARAGDALSIAGARHTMGDQQFLSHGWVVDMAAMNRVLAFDAERGLVECEAGIQWPELIDHLARAQRANGRSGASRRSRPAPTASASAARSPPTCTAAASPCGRSSATWRHSF